MTDKHKNPIDLNRLMSRFDREALLKELSHAWRDQSRGTSCLDAHLDELQTRIDAEWQRWVTAQGGAA